MPIDVVTEIVIDRPRDAVATYAGDSTHAPEWYANIRPVEWRTVPPVGVGSRMEFVAQFLGRRLAYTYEVVELTPASGSSCAPNNAHSRWRRRNSGSPVGYATRMTLRNRGGPSGFSRLAAPFMASAVRRANRKDLARLQEILEKGSPW